MVYLSVPGLKALGWTFIAIDIFLTAGRLLLRWYLSKLRGIPAGIRRFNIEDGLQVFALFCAITYLALQTSGLNTFIKIENWNIAHKGHAIDLGDESNFFHIRFGAVLIFWLCIYSVKFSFLLLYRSLFWISQRFRQAWWCVFVFTMTSFWASFFSCFWVCGYPINPLNLKQCLDHNKVSKVQTNIEYVWCAVNATSSILIFILPLAMLKGLNMDRTRKLTLSGVFALGALDIFFDIFRTFYTTDSVGVQNLWEILEVTISVMLSALVAYGKAFNIRSKLRSASSSQRWLKSDKSGGTYPGSHGTSYHTQRSENHPDSEEMAHLHRKNFGVISVPSTRSFENDTAFTPPERIAV